ncbi:TonB-dependent receptor [Sphingomonas bacterium]|uniref:TonB-dependent receptor n=1 Tax=Sphingomonas bacterium TaxID=1895847 RepID=UPI0015758C17|nr:TonB-dependent receptor [Sphingomonas bacterium]
MRKLLLAGTAMALALVPGMALAQDAGAQQPVGAGNVPAAQDSTGQPPVAAGNAVPSQQASGIQDGSATADATAQTQASTGIQDIIVTAQRREESSQKAAIAISVVGGAGLIGAGIAQPERLNQLVPALTIANVGPSATSFIRGVGNFSVSVTSDPAVAFNYDGVYIGRLTATSTTFFDIDRVEVLKGPQGTLYGRNATAGAINVLPTQPKIGELSGYGTISYGNYHALVGEAAVNLPIGDNGAVRISGVINDRHGYESDGTSDDKSEGLRLQVKAKLTPALTARLSFDYSHLGGAGAGASYLNTYVCGAATPTTPGRTPHCIVTPTNIPRSDGILSARSQAFETSRNSAIAGRKYDPFPSLYQDSSFYGSNADIEYDTGVGTLTVIPAVRFDHVVNRNAGGGFPIANNQKDIQYSVETRFAGKVNLFDYTLGFFYYNEDAKLQAGTVASATSENFQDPTQVKTESYAPFLRLTANLTNRLRLVGGIRYTHDHKDFLAHGITIAETCNAGFTCPTAILPPAITSFYALPFAVPANQSATPSIPVRIAGPTPNTTIARTDIFFNNKLSNGHATYRGAVEFDLAPASLLYASYETGFRSGGFNNAVGLETFQPEYLDAFTVGSKNRFFDNRVQLNVEAFYWNYKNEQIAHAAVDALNRPGSYTQNIGKSKIKGVEAEGRVLVTKTTELTADVQYLDAKDKSFTYSTLGYPYTNCAVSPSTLPPLFGLVPFFNVNCAGQRSYNAPKWSVNLGGSQTVPLGDYKIVFGVDTAYKTKRYTYFDYATEQLQPSSWTTNAQVSFGPKDGHFSVQGFVRNIENDRLLTAPVAFGGVLTSFTTPPRTYGARLSVKF